MDMNVNDIPATDPIPILSRLTVFAKSAQPFYPPFIYTPSDPTVLTYNIGRIIPVFRAMGCSRMGTFRWDGYVKIMDMEIVPGGSDELKSFISEKVQMGGLQKERTKEQWEKTFSSSWSKVTLERVVTGIGDPMEIIDIRRVIDSLRE